MANKPTEFKSDETTLFEIDWEQRTVRTACGDFYYDYDISFDEIAELHELLTEDD